MVFHAKSVSLSLAFAVVFSAGAARHAQGQQQDAPQQDAQQQSTDNAPPKHILLLIPNFRTSPTLREYAPLTVKEKFKVARQDAFDRGTVGLAAIFAGTGQLSNSNPSFGQGVEGYVHRTVTAYADFAVGDYMTEAIYPTILHQDPRYFRRGTGCRWSRLAYSVGQIVLTHGDSGHTQFNFSEIMGNSTAVAISMAYYPDSRSAHDAITALSSQLIVDTASNVLKEFWPDVDRKFSRRSKSKDQPVQ